MRWAFSVLFAFVCVAHFGLGWIGLSALLACWIRLLFVVSVKLQYGVVMTYFIIKEDAGQKYRKIQQ